MARKANFCKQEKLEQAMALFWSKGFANTSINDLTETLAINRFSLYNTFGDKETLYYQALDNYLSSISFPKLEPLRARDADIDTLETFLVGFAEKQKENTCGCFIQNAVVEHAGENQEVLKRSDALFNTLQTAIVEAITSAQNQSQISRKQDAESLGQFVICQMQGMRVLGKAKRYQEIDTATQVLLQYLKSA
ncbi:TetR/AcrR family transcriptional regulator [Vibrio sp. SCSIO 43140]|uniref:TetR/AcrR family transcriptional regulator n=1 Tax=Vibrio sp. SCSIO 43140 TaxID=2819100 RepID=UPI0020761A7D|nr:TetR/AcrR family transcriptional regulator [Vibrio sp. SCSIO 43140]USD62413.1 TetR/AcrR family transcriptional regulator [Vibrio sp. SCSIO 43140]